uniref:Uncharacterized protein n=1 Tax=Glossina pallidipes TaxID=7398 RepID=A0A1A9ZLZ5_GLOPL
MDIILLRWCVDNADDHDHLQLQQLHKRDMTSPTNDVIEKNILPETTITKRQRAGDEDSGGSEASVGFEKVLKLLAALSLMCTYPMQLDAAYHYIADEFNIDNKKAAQYGLRALLVVRTRQSETIYSIRFESL